MSELPQGGYSDHCWELLRDLCLGNRPRALPRCLATGHSVLPGEHRRDLTISIRRFTRGSWQHSAAIEIIVPGDVLISVRRSDWAAPISRRDPPCIGRDLQAYSLPGEFSIADLCSIIMQCTAKFET